MTPLLDTRPDVMALLEDRGHRATATRRQIIRVIESKPDSFAAEEISDELPGVGRATVYRTMKLLLQAGIVCKLSLPNGAPTYTLARIEHHHHTVCVDCGAVSEFRDSTIERLLKAIGGDISGKILGHRIEFYITCQRCSSDQAA